MAKKPKERERATELEWLTWFCLYADFGPANGGVRDIMADEFMCKTGKNLPDGWNYYQDGETLTDNFWEDSK